MADKLRKEYFYCDVAQPAPSWAGGRSTVHAVIQSCRAPILRLLDFHILIPYLNRAEIFQVPPTLRVNDVISSLSECTGEQLKMFIQILRETAGEVGSHIELAEALEKSLKDHKMKDEDKSTASRIVKSDLDIEKNVIQIVQRSFEVIGNSYTSYVDSLYMMVKNKGVSTAELRVFLLNLPAFKKFSDLKLLSDFKDDLATINEVSGIFYLLKFKFGSFLNYTIFEAIRKKYDPDMELNYSIDLKAFLEKHSLHEFMMAKPNIKKSFDEISKKMILKLNCDDTCRLHFLDEVKKVTADILGLHLYTLRIFNIKAGVKLTLLIPGQVADSIFSTGTEFTVEQKQKFREASVLLLQCSGLTFDFKKKRIPASDSEIQQACVRAIKEKITVEICPVRFNLLGLPRSGKTSFWLRLLGKIVDISWFERMKGRYVQPSTGVAEDGGQIMVCSDLCTISSQAWCALTSFSQEVAMICQLLYQTIKSSSSPKQSVQPISLMGDKMKRPGLAAKVKHFIGATTSLSTPALAPTTDGPDIKDLISVISEALNADDIERVKSDLDNFILVISTDTGGQAELLDLQASLIQGPSFNLLFNRLVDQLDDQFQDYYTNEAGVSTEKVDSNVTVEEVLFQALSCIACFSDCFTEKALPQACTQEDESQSKVMLIGTHRDLVSDEEFKKKDQQLQEKIRNTEFFTKGIIEFAAEDQLMLAVDNMCGGEQEIRLIRSVLERVIARSFKRVSIPASWLLLNLMMRSLKVRTMSLRECEELAGKLRILPEELQHALWFLHHRVGVILYYSEVESLKDTVICDMQMVFDSATNLIKNTFTFDRAGQAVSERFREKALFSLKDLKTAMSHHSNELLPPSKLVELLQYLGILTPIPSASGMQLMYFMPCVLKSALASELIVPSRSEHDPISLMLRYDCGYVPIGVFPCMIVNLVSSQQEIGWEMVEEGLRKNRVQFRVLKDCETITLVSHARFFEIAITRYKDCKTSIESICSHVRSVIKSTLNTVTSRMNYRFTMDCKFAFECPLHPGRKHLCVLATKTSNRMLCLQNKESVQLLRQHKIWFFEKTGLEDSSSCITHIHPSINDKPLLSQLVLLKVGDKSKRIVDEVSVNWEKLALQLKFGRDMIEAIKVDYFKIKEQCQYMLRLWLAEYASCPVTWEMLVEAIRNIPNPSLATQLEELLLQS